MTYVIVKNRKTVVSAPFDCYFSALKAANRMFGRNVETWLDENIRVEENR